MEKDNSFIFQHDAPVLVVSGPYKGARGFVVGWDRTNGYAEVQWASGGRGAPNFEDLAPGETPPLPAGWKTPPR